MTEHDLNLSRRGFVKGGAGLSFSFAVGGFLSAKPTEVLASTGNAQTIGGWVTISPTGAILIQAPASEMGQGVMTGIPMVIAEELDADWSKVSAQMTPPADPKTFGNPKLGGILHTVASKTTEGYWDKARIAGAQARRVLMQAAADKWGVPVAEVTTEPSMVVHAASGRKLSYGEIAGFAKLPAQLPAITEADLKVLVDALEEESAEDHDYFIDAGGGAGSAGAGSASFATDSAAVSAGSPTASA